MKEDRFFKVLMITVEAIYDVLAFFCDELNQCTLFGVYSTLPQVLTNR